jgi:hypothetical protein
MFNEILNDTVLIVNASGQRSGPFRCALSKEKVTIMQPSLDVAEGDKVLRSLPNGRTESYTVLHVHYTEKFYDIPATYALSIRKDASLLPSEGGRTTNVHISNSHGFQVGDHNVQQIVNSFSQLVQQIEAADAPAEQKADAKARLLGFLSHPLVNTALGSGATGLIELLK